MQKFHTFYLKNLHMSEKSCNFARKSRRQEKNSEKKLQDECKTH